MIVGDIITCLDCQQELCKRCIYTQASYPHFISHTIVKTARTLPTCFRARSFEEFKAVLEGAPTLFPSTIATIASAAGTQDQSTLVDDAQAVKPSPQQVLRF